MLRASRSQMFFQVDIFKNFTIFTGNYQYCSLFLIKLPAWRPATLLKKDSNTGAAVNISKFLKAAFLQNTSCGCFCILKAAVIPCGQLWLAIKTTNMIKQDKLEKIEQVNTLSFFTFFIKFQLHKSRKIVQNL